jgi:CheY-like chemotaxis protein
MVKTAYFLCNFKHLVGGQMENNYSKKSVDILLVDDDPQDVLLTREALADVDVPHQLFVVHNGQEAIHFLRREGPYHSQPKPNLIIMDLNMPVMDGHAMLKIVKNDPELGRIPVVVFSSSADEADVIQSYQSYANSFVQKPTEWQAFKTNVRGIVEFWFSTPELPRAR